MTIEEARNITHEDVCTLLENDEDKDILTRKLFDVNLRLMRTSPDYKRIVLAAAEYITYLTMTERPGYKKPRGFSGANAGIPFNIIALADGTTMLNPRVLRTNGRVRFSDSNCGSLRLKQPIRIGRNDWIYFEYYDIEGKRHEDSGYLPTVQHEIDHNNGVLITDRKV